MEQEKLTWIVWMHHWDHNFVVAARMARMMEALSSLYFVLFLLLRKRRQDERKPGGG